MKLLLDENLPVKLKFSFDQSHEVFTVNDMGWNAKKNGELLGLMVMSGFEGLVTMDKNLQHQQNIGKFPIKLLVLDVPNNKLDTLKPYIKELLHVLEDIPSTQVIRIKVS